MVQHHSKRGALQPESWTKKTLEPNSGGENRGWFAAVGGAQIHLAGSFILEPSPQSLWFGWDPNTIGHAAVCDFCAPKQARRVTFFSKRSFLVFFGGESLGFLEYFTGKPLVSGKPFPCPTPRWGQPPTVKNQWGWPLRCAGPFLWACWLLEAYGRESWGW